MMEHKGYISVKHHPGDTTTEVPNYPRMYYRRSRGELHLYYCHYQPLKSGDLKLSEKGVHTRACICVCVCVCVCVCLCIALA